MLDFKKVADRAWRKAAYFGKTSINAAITLTVRTHKRRWAKVAKQDPPWDARNRLIVSFIPENSSVVDIGSGAMTIKRHLKPACRYQPCDVVQSTPEVILCDFNAAVYPALTEKYDYVICSGVLEYIKDPADFLFRVSRFGKKVLLSYNPLLEGQTKLYRLGNNWVNHLKRPELENLIKGAGLTFELLNVSTDQELLYELAPA